MIHANWNLTAHQFDSRCWEIRFQQGEGDRMIHVVMNWSWRHQYECDIDDTDTNGYIKKYF